MNDRYNTFWPRFGAAIIDGVIFTPLLFSKVFLNMENVQNIILIDSLHLALFTSYLVIGHGKFGYTLGKNICNLRLLDVSENSPIGIRRAFLRESVWVLLSILALVDFIVRTRNIEFISTSERDQTVILDWISLGWLALEFLTMLSNNKRRALHDYIAKSVVIRINQDTKTQNH
jgi:uncharacterized RDD family membrane protein YckC